MTAEMLVCAVEVRFDDAAQGLRSRGGGRRKPRS